MTLNIDLPDEKPRITGIKEKYQIGETLEALCTSWQSHPPANLTWFINEEKVRLNQTTINYISNHSHNKTSTSLDFNYVKPCFDLLQFKYNFRTNGFSNLNRFV